MKQLFDLLIDALRYGGDPFMEPMKPIEPVQNLFLKQWFDENQDKLYETARYIFRHPELAEKETLSSRCLADYLERQGFRIRFGISGFETAFIAEWGSGTPILGFLAEYDALPGLCQPPLCHREQTDQPGHGCGHNLLGTACAGSAAALKALMVKEHLPGTLRVYGCPAEETVIGKIRMNQDGVFDDLSAAITWHPFDRNRISYDIWQSQDIKNYIFHGISSHAAKQPELGRSALDAAELMNVGVNYLREHVTDDVRMHYTYTNTGGPANVVPALASTNYFIRSAKYERIMEVSKRVDDCARGAAMMTGTTVEIQRVTCNQEMKVNRPLAESFHQAMERIPLPQYTSEELSFAAAITEAASLPNSASEYFGPLEPLEDKPVIFPVGTDVSDVSHTVPTIMLSVATMCKGTPLHHWTTTAQSGSTIGEKGMLYAARCMSEGALDLLTKPRILEQAWDAFHQKETI